MAATQVGLKPPLDSLTPAMRQYVEQKKRVGDAVLLFRMGDFYETFYDDAVLCSRVLGIALTSRDKNSASPVPLAGIPYHALDGYLSKLVVAGHKVAISEQMEDPKQAKGVVRRDVVRIVTPGTLTEETLLADRDDNVLAALCLRGEEVGLAIVELACGRFETIELETARHEGTEARRHEGNPPKSPLSKGGALMGSLLDTLVRLRPAELLIAEESGPEAEQIAQGLRSLCGTAITRRPVHEFSEYQAQRTLLEHFGVATLAGFGFDKPSNSLVAAGGIIQYLQETQKTALAHVSAIRRRDAAQSVQIDHSSWRSLEIDRTLRGGQREGSLLHAIDRTVHAAGARMLRHWLASPLTDANTIRERQQAVGFLVEEGALRERIRQRLKHLADVERIAGRVSLGRASPRDMESLGRTLSALPTLLEEGRLGEIAFLYEIIVNLNGTENREEDRPLAGARGSDAEGTEAQRHGGTKGAESSDRISSRSIGELAHLLQGAIRESPSNNLREGGFIADGYHGELDRLRGISHDGQTWLAEYQLKEIERTGIAHLKAGYNRVFGYYLEVPHSGTAKVPADFIRKQTVKNAERYITETLKNYEHEVLTAQDRANQLEFELFEELRKKVAQWLVPLGRVAEAIARLDCVAALAEFAEERRCVRPDIVDDGRLEIIDGRHPVLDQAIGDAFVPNDTCMAGQPGSPQPIASDNGPRSVGPVALAKAANTASNQNDARVFVITGPNMAGKSTYIRQVALLTIMAQIGAFVPARRMSLSLVDRIFARVGSSDEIMRGQSTFMVEMVEAANILHNATRNSLVILDELGRGTSTFDGLSLAWAVTEHLAEKTGCRTLIATHYHELIELGSLLKNVKNFNVAVRENRTVAKTEDRRVKSERESTIDNRQSTIPESSIVFLHKIVEGGANQSFGIHVARLAGVPRSVVDRSREVLDQLQRRLAGTAHLPTVATAKSRDVDQLALFREPGDELIDALLGVDPDQLTPLEALTRIKEWKDRFI